MPDDARPDKSAQLPTNMRLLLLLEEVAARGVPVTPSEVGQSMGLPKPTVHRLFQTAEAEGFLQRDIDGRSYGPGRRLRRLAMHTASSQRVRMARLQILRQLAEEVGETCNISSPDREAMIYIDRVETKWPLRIQLPIGTEVPFHCTASGKMYLSSLKPSFLDRLIAHYPLVRKTPQTHSDPQSLLKELQLVAAQGYSTDNEEFMEGMVAVAVPIFDDRKRVISTLSVHAPVQRHTLDSLMTHLDRLRATSTTLSALLLD